MRSGGKKPELRNKRKEAELEAQEKELIEEQINEIYIADLMAVEPEIEGEISVEEQEAKDKMIDFLMKDSDYTRDILYAYSVRQIRMHYNYVTEKETEAMLEHLNEKDVVKPKPKVKSPPQKKRKLTKL